MDFWEQNREHSTEKWKELLHSYTCIDFKTMEEIKSSSHYVDIANLPGRYPTHCHQPQFWEEFGRTVASYGFLENAIGKAIFASSGQASCSEEEAPLDGNEPWKEPLLMHWAV